MSHVKMDNIRIKIQSYLWYIMVTFDPAKQWHDKLPCSLHFDFYWIPSPYLQILIQIDYQVNIYLGTVKNKGLKYRHVQTVECFLIPICRKYGTTKPSNQSTRSFQKFVHQSKPLNNVTLSCCQSWSHLGASWVMASSASSLLNS